MKGLLTTAIAVLLLTAGGMAQAPAFGVGASGGINVPIIQDDQESGSIFEIRGRLEAVPFLVVEPKLSFASYGSPDTFNDVVWDIDGSKLVMYGVDGVLSGGMSGVGFKPFFVGGIGFYNIKNDDTEAFLESKTKFGWSAGVGFALGLSPQLDLDVRGKLHVIMHEGSSSKKSAALIGGVNFYFGGK